MSVAFLRILCWARKFVKSGCLKKFLMNVFTIMYWTLCKTIKQKYTSHHLFWLRYSSSNCWYNLPLPGKFPVKIHDGALQKQPPEVFYKRSCSQKFAIFTGKHLCWSLSFNKRKRDSNTGVFLRILRNFQEHLFWRTSANGGFLVLFK